jgi:hypothetical protein
MFFLMLNFTKNWKFYKKLKLFLHIYFNLALKFTICIFVCWRAFRNLSVAPKIFTFNLQPKPLPRIQIKSLRIPILDLIEITKLSQKSKTYFGLLSPPSSPYAWASSPLGPMAAQHGRLPAANACCMLQAPAPSYVACLHLFGPTGPKTVLLASYVACLHLFGPTRHNAVYILNLNEFWILNWMWYILFWILNLNKN